MTEAVAVCGHCVCGQVSSKMGMSNRQVRNITVWGEHGETSHVDAQHAQIQQLGQWNLLTTALHDDRWLRHDLVQVPALRRLEMHCLYCNSKDRLLCQLCSGSVVRFNLVGF